MGSLEELHRVHLANADAWWKTQFNSPSGHSHCYIVFNGVPNLGYIIENPFPNMDGTSQLACAHRACHSMIRSDDNEKSLGKRIVFSAGYFNTDDRFERWWQWATGPNSPWKALMVNGMDRIFNDKGVQVAWSIPFESLNLKEIPFNLMKNFAIATRFDMETPGKIQCWIDCVDRGLTGLEAHICTTLFQPVDKELYAVGGSSSRALGWHWPFTFTDNSFEALRDGEIKPKSSTINGWWSTNGTKLAGLTSKLPEGETNVKAGHFSTTISGVTADRIVNNFNEWKVEHGLL